MRDYGKVAPTFWTRGSGKALRGNLPAQVVALYLFTAPGASMTGLYYLSLPTICHEVGLGLDVVRGALARLAELGIAHFDEAAEIAWVPEMAKYQIGQSLKSGDKRAKGVEREVAMFATHPFHADFHARYALSFGLTRSPFQAPSKPLPGDEEAPSKPLPVHGSEKSSPPAPAPDLVPDLEFSPSSRLAGVSEGLPDGPTVHEMARRCAPLNGFAAKLLADLDGGKILTKPQRDKLREIDAEEFGNGARRGGSRGQGRPLSRPTSQAAGAAWSVLPEGLSRAEMSEQERATFDALPEAQRQEYQRRAAAAGARP